MGPKSGPKLGFLLFFRFGFLVFLEIAYNISFQQCLTSSRSKTYKKNKSGSKWAKIRPKLYFQSFSQVWFIVFL